MAVALRFRCILVFLAIILVCNEITSETFPDVSENQNFCYKNLMVEKLHECQCENYNPNYLTGRNSYLKFSVSIFIDN